MYLHPVCLVAMLTAARRTRWDSYVQFLRVLPSREILIYP